MNTRLFTPLSLWLLCLSLEANAASKTVTIQNNGVQDAFCVKLLASSAANNGPGSDWMVPSPNAIPQGGSGSFTFSNWDTNADFYLWKSWMGGAEGSNACYSGNQSYRYTDPTPIHIYHMSASGVLFINISPGGVGATTYHLQEHLCNASTVTKQYGYYYGGVRIGGATLPPGACADIGLSDTSPKDLSIMAETPYYNNDGMPIGTNAVPVSTISSTDSGWTGTGTPPTGQIADGDSGAPAYGGPGTPTNAQPPISYPSTTNGPQGGLALDSTLKQVGNALYTAVNGGFQTGNGIDAANGQKLSGVSSGISGLGSKLDGVNVNLTSLGNRLDTLHSDNGGQSSSLTGIASGVTTLSGKADTQITALQQIVANTAASGGGMSNQLGQMIGLLINLTNGVNSDTPWLAHLDTGITNVNNNIQGNYTKLASIDNNDFLGRLDLDGIKSDTAVIRDNSGNIKNDLDTANGYLQRIANRGDDTHADLQNVLTQLQNLNAKATQTNVYDPQTWQQLVNLGAIIQTNNGEMADAVFKLGVLSNYMDLIAARLASSTNIATGETNELAKFHRDNTNLLSQIRDELTNNAASSDDLTNAVSDFNTASALANKALAAFNTAVDSLKSALAPPLDNGPSDVGDALKWSFMGYTIDFNPMSNSGVAGIANLIKTFLTWLLIVGYITKITKDSFEIVKVGGSAAQMQFPSMEFLGTNAGFVLIPAIILVLMILIGIFFGTVALVFSQLAGDSIAGVFHSNPLSGASGAVAVGVSLARNFFPFATLFSLTGSYFAWRLTMTGSGGFYVVAMRFIIGA